MAIVVNLDVMMARRKMSLNELSNKVDITLANLSILKTGKAKAVRFSTLEAICKALDCQPGDILEFKKFEENPEDIDENIIARLEEMVEDNIYDDNNQIDPIVHFISQMT